MKKPKIDKGIWAGVLFSLGSYTCEQLATLLETTPGEWEPAKLRKLRSMIGDTHHLRLLRLCGDAPASQWRTKIRTAAEVAELLDAPPLKLVIGGGMPKQQEMPSYTKAVKKLAEKHGIVAHRWGKGAFVLAKP